MFRKLTTTLLVAALALIAPASLLHVHRYVGHDHPEHHHGPAVHAHGPSHDGLHARALAAHDQHGTRLESCEPGEHTLPLAFTCMSVNVHAAPQVASSAVVLAAPAVRQCRRPASSDVRVHGPPGLPSSSLRAPPALPAA